jgi:hypothetical protein
MHSINVWRHESATHRRWSTEVLGLRELDFEKWLRGMVNQEWVGCGGDHGGLRVAMSGTVSKNTLLQTEH